MRIFVCKLRLHFPDNSKHLRGFVVCHEIFGNFFRHSEIFGLDPPTIHASYGPEASYKLSPLPQGRPDVNRCAAPLLSYFDICGKTYRYRIYICPQMFMVNNP
jgi:hypothetical protein